VTQCDAHTPGEAKVAAYGEFVDWEKRLGREAPFFRRAFDEVEARSVIDVGAGTAMHAILFASWGMSVDAVDPDDSMLEQAEVNIAERAEQIATAGGEVRLRRGGFGVLAHMGLGPADALVCTGNALPHAEGITGLRSALADFAAVLRPGGVVVLHLLNHGRLLAKRVRAIPPVVRDTADGTKVFLRVIEYPETAEGDVEFIDFDFVTLVRPAEGGEWTAASRRSLHTALPLDLLERELTAAGFRDVRAFGDHSGRALDRDADESVIVTARR
jgi:SAM-dependent methyltransferase